MPRNETAAGSPTPSRSPSSSRACRSPRQGKTQLLGLYSAARDPLAGRTADEKLKLLKTHELSRLPDQDLRLQRGGRELLPGPHPRLLRARHATRCRPPTCAIRAIPASAGSNLPAGGRIGPAASPTSIISPTATRRWRGCWCAALVPGVAPGNTMDDIVLAPFDYARLDSPDANVRIRLDSTCIDVRNADERGACRLCPRRQAPSRRGAARGAGLLPHDDPASDAGAAGGAARGAGAERQDADRLHQRAGAELAAVGRAQGQRDLRADVVPQPRRARLPGQPRRLPASARSRRADVPASRACGGRAQPGSHRAPAVQDRAGEAPADAVLGIRGAHPRRARPHARRRRIFQRPRHRRDHGQPLAARLRLCGEFAVRRRRL